MDDNQLDELLAHAAHDYRPPPDFPHDAIWSRVEGELSAVRRSARAPGWRVAAGALAATLVIGVALGAVLGRMSATRGAGSQLAVATAPAPRSPAAGVLASNAADPYQRTAQDFLGRTAVLLAALPSNEQPGTNDAVLAEQARQLLGTTRLLLDSPVGREPQMKDLLEDLELVLAQVARLQPKRPGEALTLINEALEEHDVVPRIRSAVAGLSGSDH